MAEVAFDVVEQILLRLDVKDLLRYKSVCKSWQSLISSPCFVKAHLNHTYNNDRNNPELGHRRIANGVMIAETYSLALGLLHVVGSCNGLVCLSPRDVEFVVTNPWTREVKKLQAPPYTRCCKTGSLRSVVCWGFGYDSSADDYKVIAGFRERSSTLFYVLALKSNVWKVIGHVRYRCVVKYCGVTGVLSGGALCWFMTSSSVATERVIISLDLSTHEFKEIPKPKDAKPKREYTLGVLEECLCMYSLSSSLSCKKWVLKDNKWEPHDDYFESKYDVAHRVLESGNTFYAHDDDFHVISVGPYIRASILVKSLVSPRTDEERRAESRNAMGHESSKVLKGNIKKRSRSSFGETCKEPVWI